MARLPADRYTSPWGDAEPCPCGSGAKFVSCCKRPKSLPYITLPILMPPGKLTGHQNPACYMSSTMNCSAGKSREHYVSESILRRFDQLSVSGMPWQTKGEAQVLPTKALVANVLCERHNSALAPIDEMGLRAFDAFISATDYAVNHRNPGRTEHHLISGEGFELWMYKLMAGIHFGGIASADGRIARDYYRFPLEQVVQALCTGSLPPNAGLLVMQNLGLVQRSQITVGPLIGMENQESIGVQVQFGALRFETTIIPPPITFLHRAKLTSRHRPRVIDIIGPERDGRVILTWKGQTNAVKRIGIEVRPE